MIARLRRHRWLFAVSLAASPAFAGQVLPVVHPCPVDSPWLAGTHSSMPGMAHHGSHAPGHEAAHHCTCIGCCAAAAIIAPPKPFVATVAIEVPRHATWPVIEATNYRPASVDRLPEKTAPPLA